MQILMNKIFYVKQMDKHTSFGVIRDFSTILKSGPGACWIWEKIWTIKIGKIDTGLPF